MQTSMFFLISCRCFRCFRSSCKISDRLTGRWFIVGINLQAAPNLVVLAVQALQLQTPSSFTFYSFAVNTGGATSGFGDYPTLGVDNSALYT